jgi:two-component sensor histidine kinase
MKGMFTMTDTALKTPLAALTTHIEVHLKPSVRFVSLARRFVSDAYTDILSNSDLAWRLGMVTHELLENAVKYSADGSMMLRIGVEATAGDEKKMLVVTLQNKADHKHAETIRQMFKEMREIPDAAEYYQLLMERTAEHDNGSGLGLGRIRLEADMSLTCEIEDDIVCISARAPIA